jgi:hypothetical protein
MSTVALENWFFDRCFSISEKNSMSYTRISLFKGRDRVNTVVYGKYSAMKTKREALISLLEMQKKK